MRTDQFMGLTEVAEKIVAGEQVFLYAEDVRRTYPDSHEETLPTREVYGSNVRHEDSGQRFTGMFDNEYTLTRYVFPDGRVLTEAVQADPWSSGPCFFLALKDETGAWVKESLWTEEEIERA